LWIKQLPFADDIREPPETNLVRAPDEVTDAMRVIVQQLQLPKAVYDPSKYPNPSLQWFFKILQALALEEDLPEKGEDKTLPRWRQIHKRAGQYVVEFGDKLDQAYRQWQKDNAGQIHSTSTGGAKRSKPSSSRDTSKRVKQEDGDDTGPTEEEMRMAYEKDAISKYTVAHLRAFLQGKGLSTTGKKSDLVDAVTRYFETRMNVD
jgi:ATP-dependent DNA helicase 2 subunit 1